MSDAQKIAPDSTGLKQDTRFKPGQSGNPAGRPKGARNKVTENLLEALASDFEAHGKEVIEKVRAEKPHDYLKIVAFSGAQANGGREQSPTLCHYPSGT